MRFTEWEDWAPAGYSLPSIANVPRNGISQHRSVTLHLCTRWFSPHVLGIGLTIPLGLIFLCRFV
jgi:hypothetical protein